MKKKFIVVTAGSRGIGAAIVKKLVECNYYVVFTYHTNKNMAESLTSSLNRNSDVCSCYPCDVTRSDFVKQFCEFVLEKYGTPYGIVNNAGISKDNFLVNTSIENWSSVIDTNLNSVFYMTQFFLTSMMLVGDGSIINISSVSGIRGNAGQTSYSASKAAQIGFTKSLARETGVFNIRVNCIAPGAIETDMISSIPKKYIDMILRNTALRKIGKVEDIANMVEFLLGQGGEYITGQTLVIDGGLSI